MAKLCVVIFPSDHWRFSKMLEVDSIPREGENVHCGDDCYLKVDCVAHDLSKNLVEINLHCDGDLSTVASWLMEIPSWEIWGEKWFRKDEAEIRRHILEQYEEDDFVPTFAKEEN